MCHLSVKSNGSFHDLVQAQDARPRRAEDKCAEQGAENAAVSDGESATQKVFQGSGLGMGSGIKVKRLKGEEGERQ